MRSTFRAFLMAILFTAAAGVALAQDAGAVPPPSAPPVVKPVAPLPALPFANPQTPAVEPALAAGQTPQTDPAVVSPAPLVAVAPSAAEKPVATTRKHVAKPSAKKPAAKPVVELNQSFESVAPAAAAATDATTNVPPPVAAASSVVPETVAPPPSAENAAAVESRSDVTKSQTTMGVGGWLLFGIGVVFLFGIITVIRRRRTQTQRQPSIVDFANAPAQLAPVLAPRR